MSKLLPAIFFLIIFALSINPFPEYDIWFHLKSGEIIAKQGIINHDVFSQAIEKREWYPYEWLFQLTVYQIQQILGFEAIKYFTALIVTLMIGVIYLILNKIFGLNYLLSLLACFFFFASSYDFFTSRPHVLAYTFFTINLYLILLYLFKTKNLLWLTIPITLLWANLHGSVFLSYFLFLAYGLVSFIYYLLLKDTSWLKKIKVLSFFSVITFVITILPPLGTLQYRLIWLFVANREIITNFIDEWRPLSITAIDFESFVLGLILSLLFLAISIFKNRDLKQLIWLVPIVPLIPIAFIAVRNLILGYIALTFILGWSLSNIKFKIRPINFFVIFIGTAVFMTFFYSSYVLYIKKHPEKVYFPTQATQFIKEQNLQGNMFNGIGVGGYLLYHLYPDKKVFIDGRVDVYLCCEIPDIVKLLSQKELPEKEFTKYLEEFLSKYDISYVILRTEKFTASRRIGLILTDHQNWELVYWDDFFQIIVKKDGKNEKIVEQFGVFAATPFHQNVYRDKMQDQAFREYKQMISIANSARSRNAIGYIFLQQEKYDQARKEFEKAAEIDSTFTSPFMNLGELALKDGDLQKAIDFYEQALSLSPDRGFIYLRLGELYIEAYSNQTKAKKIWQRGLDHPLVDSESKTKLNELLNTKNTQ